MAYELAHKCTILPHVRVRQLLLRDHEKEESPRPLLISESILPTVYATMVGPVLAPYHLMGDLMRIEVAAKGLDRKRYGIRDLELQDYITFWEIVSM